MFAVPDAPPTAAAISGATEAPGVGGGLGGGGAAYSGESDGPRTEHDLRAENLINLLESNVAPQSWDTVGGVGSISEYNGLLVVTQTLEVHREVERVLDMLREAAGLPGPGKVVR